MLVSYQNMLHIILLYACTGNSRPTLRELDDKVTPYFAAHWRRIGKFLDIIPGELDIIESDNFRNCRECCNKMFTKWLDVDTRASWEKLKHCIKLAIQHKTGT